jgi:D-glycero-D-manno-heptose 1,7-bisphosphate phosphatase
MILKTKKSDRTLFLDRDGVVNQRLIDNYVKNWDEFEFMTGVLEAIPLLNAVFNRIIMVTNQQGIGKKIMTKKDLELIHLKMMRDIRDNGGNIDGIYFCPQTADEQDNCRKPGSKMAFRAKKDFSDIEFCNSFMVGDQASDIVFGKKLEMNCVWIPEDPETIWPIKDIKPDFIFKDLLSFALEIYKDNGKKI